MADNNEKKIELEEGEIMRMSVRIHDPETGAYAIDFVSDGEPGVIVQAIERVMEQEFGLICVPKDARLGIAICFPHYEEDEDEESEENETAEENTEE